MILEYCGGAATDRLFAGLSRRNPQATIFVLDNASPTNPAQCVTHRNATNSNVGNGIKDCIALAEQAGAKYLFFLANDVKWRRAPDLRTFERVMEGEPDIVHLSCSVTPKSDKAKYFPWTTQRRGRLLRQVRHADILASMLRLDFIREFGGFPDSVGGWGYDREIAYHARRLGRKVVVCDACPVYHQSPPGYPAVAPARMEEMHAIYDALYPGEPVLEIEDGIPLPDEEAELPVKLHTRLQTFPTRIRVRLPWLRAG